MTPDYLTPPPRRSSATTVGMLLLLFSCGAATGLTWNRTECHAPNDRQFLRVLYSNTSDATMREQAIGQAGALATQIVERLVHEAASSDPRVAGYALSILANLKQMIR